MLPLRSFVLRQSKSRKGIYNRRAMLFHWMQWMVVGGRLSEKSYRIWTVFFQFITETSWFFFGKTCYRFTAKAPKREHDMFNQERKWCECHTTCAPTRKNQKSVKTYSLCGCFGHLKPLLIMFVHNSDLWIYSSDRKSSTDQDCSSPACMCSHEVLSQSPAPRHHDEQSIIHLHIDKPTWWI